MDYNSEDDLPHNFLAVVAIDIGSAYSGYAYQFRSDAKFSLVDKIHSPVWRDPVSTLVSTKTVTSLLLNPDKSFNSFGYDAEKKYTEMHTSYEDDTFHDDKFPNNTPSDWYFFRRFKMQLYKKEQIKKNSEIKDEQGKSLPMRQVLRECISYFKHHVTECMATRADIQEEDILWVLTVPAIWSEPAKKFMREAATEAGISDGSLHLALEPEAAALFCKRLSLFRVQTGTDNELMPFSPGSTIMVVDLGGGTGDITIHEVQSDGTLHEKEKASGGDWGGNQVNKEFEYIWRQVIGRDEFRKLRKDYPQEILEFDQNFELTKRNLAGTMSIPQCIKDVKDLNSKLCKFCTEKYGDSTAISIKRRGNKVEFKDGVLKSLFSETIIKIVRHLDELVKEHSELTAILLVGGFSECKIVYKEIKNHFPDLRIFNPDDSSLSVLKGAVIYGFKPFEISKRVSRYSYGFSSSLPFDDKKNNNSRDLRHRYNDRLEDIFKPIIRAGESIKANEIREYECRPHSLIDKRATIDFYSTLDPAPKYVYDPEDNENKYPSINIGQIVIQSKNAFVESDVIKLRVMFGLTELEVSAEIVGDQTCTANASFQLLK